VNDYAASLGSLSKNDRKDSVMLARYGLERNSRVWQPSPLEISHLHALLGRLDTLQDTLQQEQNRLDALHMQAQHPTTVKESLEASITYLQKSMQKLRQQIDDHIDRHPGLKSDQKLLETIPGIGSLSAQRMIAVIRSRDFRKASEVAAFLGLIPVEHTSGTTVRKRPHLSRRGDSKLRGKLFMPVVAAITHNPTIQKFYRKLLEQKKHQRAAMTAAMRKLVHICFGVLKNQQAFSAAV
jgi:transposase